MENSVCIINSVTNDIIEEEEDLTDTGEAQDQVLDLENDLNIQNNVEKENSIVYSIIPGSEQGTIVNPSLNSEFAIKSGKVISAQAGTSKKGSESCRNMKFLLKMESHLNLNDVSLKPKKKHRSLNEKRSTIEAFNEDSGFLTSSILSSEQLKDQVEDEEQPEANELITVEDTSEKNRTKKIKKTVLTILLTHRWQKTNKNNKAIEKKLVLQPTFKMG